MFEVLSTSGDTHLGGDDFDRRIVDFLADDFQRNENIDLRKDRQALQRLTEAAEKAKMELSTLSQVSSLANLALAKLRVLDKYLVGEVSRMGPYPCAYRQKLKRGC